MGNTLFSEKRKSESRYFLQFFEKFFSHGDTDARRGDLQQEQQSTEGYEDNEGLLLRNPNWIFVFLCCLLCKTILPRITRMTQISRGALAAAIFCRSNHQQKETKVTKGFCAKEPKLDLRFLCCLP